MKAPDGNAPSARRLTYSEASRSPCETCAASPCCTHLPLHNFRVESLAALDHVRYLLNFENIEVGLSASGEWSVFYALPCRYLSSETYGCTVHGTVAQPRICAHYSPYTCWYRRAFSKESERFLRIEAKRLQFLLDEVVFDQDRNIVEVPDWDAIAAVEAPISEPVPSRVEEDPVFDRWLEATATGADPREPGGLRVFGDFLDPCTGCAAYCCKTLVFPVSAPQTASGLDFLRFVLGFPGMEIGVSDRGWSYVVRTRCRHLHRDRCSIYGEPERPLLCSYYDAQSCHYTWQFGQPRPEGFFRFRLEQWHWVAEVFRFDDAGTALGAPSTEAIRRHVEARWREEMQAAAAAAAEDVAATEEPREKERASAPAAEPGLIGLSNPRAKEPSQSDDAGRA